MALLTFTPPIGPSPGTGIQTELKLLEAEFGDGYTSSTPDGINYRRRTVSIAWDGLTPAQMTTIESFFYSHAGHTPFYYQPAGFAAPLKWVCKEWTSKLDKGVWKMTATLRQSFDLRT